MGGGGTNRRQVANLHPKYPKNRKSHRIWTTSFSILGGTSPPKFVTGGTRLPRFRRPCDSDTARELVVVPWLISQLKEYLLDAATVRTVMCDSNAH